MPCAHFGLVREWGPAETADALCPKEVESRRASAAMKRPLALQVAQPTYSAKRFV
jgi:hypothetical protein